ncbi:MAG TPA: hypothetical protein VGS57_17525 [Thermoanaerobaculia bacterium]|jgi:hypothetical protein|nr:hypothetical protein [Thermoanaerobaculia bacterium]
MRGRRPSSAFRAGVLVAVAALPLATAVRAQELVTEVGNEQLVASTGDWPSIVYDNQGRGVIAWVEAGSSAAAQSIRASRLSGITLGAPFQVSAPSSVPAGDPRVAMDPQGNFVVVWSANEVHGQLYRNDGRARGAQLLLSTRNVGGSHPEVAMAPDGRFVLGWEQSTWDPMRTVRLATFNNRGGRLSRSTLTMPAIGTLANLVGAVSASPASVAVGWTEFTPCQSNPIDPVSAVATFNWALTPLREVDRLANDNPCVDGPQVLALPNSDFGPLGIFVGRRYSIQRFSPADGTRVGPRTNVAEFPCTGSNCDRVKTVAGDRRGRFVFVWEHHENGVYSLYGELYGREGTKRVERFTITAGSSASEERPSAALTNDGTLVVTWHRDGEGVLMRRFRIE